MPQKAKDVAPSVHTYSACAVSNNELPRMIDYICYTHVVLVHSYCGYGHCAVAILSRTYSKMYTLQHYIASKGLSCGHPCVHL